MNVTIAPVNIVDETDKYQVLVSGVPINDVRVQADINRVFLQMVPTFQVKVAAVQGDDKELASWRYTASIIFESATFSPKNTFTNSPVTCDLPEGYELIRVNKYGPEFKVRFTKTVVDFVTAADDHLTEEGLMDLQRRATRRYAEVALAHTDDRFWFGFSDPTRDPQTHWIEVHCSTMISVESTANMTVIAETDSPDDVTTTDDRIFYTFASSPYVTLRATFKIPYVNAGNIGYVGGPSDVTSSGDILMPSEVVDSLGDFVWFDISSESNEPIAYGSSLRLSVSDIDGMAEYSCVFLPKA